MPYNTPAANFIIVSAENLVTMPENINAKADSKYVQVKNKMFAAAKKNVCTINKNDFRKSKNVIAQNIYAEGQHKMFSASCKNDGPENKTFSVGNKMFSASRINVSANNKKERVQNKNAKAIDKTV